MKKMNKAREQLLQMYIDSLKEDKLPWKKGWNEYAVYPFNPVSKSRYRGINSALLSYVSLKRGYEDPRWVTFKQIENKGWKLEDAKGKGVPVEFWSIYDSKNKRTVTQEEYTKILDTEPERKDDFRMMDRIYYVFNAEHVKGIPEYKLEIENMKVKDTSQFIDNLIKNMGVAYEEVGDSAFYSPVKDKVTLPPSKQFHSQYEYEATKLHELCHATGHSSRLDRPLASFFGSMEYAKEELRAEIAASLIASEVSVEPSMMELDNHKAYIQSWIETLNKEPSELFKAIKDAEKICDYVIDKGELDKIREIESKNNSLKKDDRKPLKSIGLQGVKELAKQKYGSTAMSKNAPQKEQKKEILQK